MISEILTPVYSRAAMIPEQSAASPENPDRPLADCSHKPSARGGVNLRSAQPDLPSDDPVITRKSRANLRPRLNGRFLPRPERPREAEIFEAAKRPVIKEILELEGGNIRSLKRFEKYLQRLSFGELRARRDQLKAERLPMQRDLFGQPELNGGAK